MRSLILFAFLGLSQAGLPQDPQPPQPIAPDINRTSDIRLPSGKLMRDEILKSEYHKSLQDAAEMVRLSQEVQADLEKSSAFVVPVQTLKKTEDIEKLAKRIRARMKG